MFQLNDVGLAVGDPACLQIFKETNLPEFLVSLVVWYLDDEQNNALIFLNKDKLTQLRDYINELLKENTNG